MNVIITIAIISSFVIMDQSTSVVVRASTPSVKQGFFYTPPTDGTSAATMAAKASFVVLTDGGESYRDSLRAHGFDGPILQYFVSAEVEGPGPYANASAACDASYVPLRNQVTDRVGDFCTLVHPNESWFLHNGAGQRLYGYWGSRIYYHMNPASTGWRTFALQRMSADLLGSATQDRLGYSGIFLDNVELSLVKARTQLANSDGTVREFSSDADFRNAWAGYLSALRGTLRAAGPMWANMISDPNEGNSWDLYLQHLDGGMFEAFATGYNGLTPAKWENNIRQVESALRAGKGVLTVGRGTKGDTTKQTLALASYLLVSDGGNAFFRYGNSSSYGQWWQYPNYDVALGAPLGGRYESGSTWRRDFECGYVTVDPAARTGSITQTTCGSQQTPSPAPDAPVVTLAGVSNGQTVSGTITVEAQVTSNVAIRNVKFYLDGVEIDHEGIRPYWLGGDERGVPKGYSTSSWAPGTRLLSVVATDVDGRQGSVSVVVRVGAGVAPDRSDIAVTAQAWRPVDDARPQRRIDDFISSG
jgi:hypothetical protein